VSADRATVSWPTEIVVEGRRQELPDPVVVEEPLEIRVAEAEETEARPLAVTMRTPGDDAALAAGLLYTEGLVEAAADLARLQACAGGDANRVVVRLRPGLALDRERGARAFLSTSACGVCGKTAIESVFARGFPLLEPTRPAVARLVLESLPERMRAAQTLFARTGGLHAAALFDADGELRVLREDVGRHNAVDKVVGERLLAGEMPLRDALLVVSGRAGFEIVQKAARAGIGLLAAVGAPTSLSLRTAERTGMTLVGFLRSGRFNLYTGSSRVRG
jgi:FdhD protein